MLLVGAADTAAARAELAEVRRLRLERGRPLFHTVTAPWLERCVGAGELGPEY